MTKLWKAAAHSAPGTSHKAQGLPCQDHADYIVVNDFFVGAVADGAGSAVYSQEGSKLAVSESLNHARDFFYSKKSFNSSNEAKLFFEELLDHVRAKICSLSRKTHASIDDFATTLLVFIASPSFFSALQIGDGFIVVSSNADNFELIFEPRKGEFANETVFITSQGAFTEMKVFFENKDYDFVCASTDGLERLAINFREMSPYTPFFRPLKLHLEGSEREVEIKAYLDSFLDSESLNAKTDDDKTILLCSSQVGFWHVNKSKPSISTINLSVPGKTREVDFNSAEIERRFSDTSSFSRKTTLNKSHKNRVVTILLVNFLFSFLIGLAFESIAIPVSSLLLTTLFWLPGRFSKIGALQRILFLVAFVLIFFIGIELYQTAFPLIKAQSHRSNVIDFSSIFTLISISSLLCVSNLVFIERMALLDKDRKLLPLLLVLASSVLGYFAGSLIRQLALFLISPLI